MSFIADLVQKLTESGGEVAPATTPTFTGDGKDNLDVSVADSSTDYLVNFALDVSLIQAIIIVSDKDVTMETNDGTTPADTINLLANNPYIWYTGSYFTNLLTTDITGLYFTNSSGGVANVKLLVIKDTTPA
ncbi:hypothetical protein LCGC14_0605960 [marine sediment metagenome]|uniref:Uncharacterized protein n=1 Tax=marine sediment metagenome TaxID=412755 RepID=A0A0F9RDY1_9ZZZZ